MQSLEGATDLMRRSLRRRQGTVKELVRRVEAQCECETLQLLQATKALLSMASVLDANIQPITDWKSHAGKKVRVLYN